FLLKKIDQEVDISIYTSNTLVDIYPLFSDVLTEGSRIHRLLNYKSADFIISLSLNESLNVLKAIDDQHHLDWLINKILEIDDQLRLERMLCYNALDFYKEHSKYIFCYLATADYELLDEFANSLLYSDELRDSFIKKSHLLGHQENSNEHSDIFE
ncbi:hypothetical protein OAP56_03575, partial [Rickettsiaceae bacterium]|nr:hypothetical protein [Rickettsiaceae bacterium]